MSPHDVYNVLELLSQGQNSGVQVLEFSIGGDFNYDAELENDTASPRDVGVDNANGDLDTGINELLDVSIQSPSERSPGSELRDASPRNVGIDSTTTELNELPVIDPSSKSLSPLSESTIKLAIKNVAQAGHLTINSEAVAINVVEAVQDLSKLGGKAKIGTSKSKKRRREEGGPSEEMPKAQRAKVAVPPREQSSRYDRYG